MLRRGLGVALIALSPGVSGCSFLFTTAPPSHAERLPPGAPLECTTSKLAPALDTTFAAAEGVRTGLALAADDSNYEDKPIGRGLQVGVAAGLTALFAAAAVYGFSITGGCKDAKLLHDQNHRPAAAPKPTLKRAPQTPSEVPETSAAPIGGEAVPVEDTAPVPAL